MSDTVLALAAVSAVEAGAAHAIHRTEPGERRYRACVERLSVVAIRYAADRLAAEGKMAGAVRWLHELADRSAPGQLDKTLLAHAREVTGWGSIVSEDRSESTEARFEFALRKLRAHALRHAARRLDATREFPAASKLLVKISDGVRP